MGTSSSKPSTEKFDPKNDLVDLKGKVVIVTGGNKGIGYTTVAALLHANAKVYLAARNEERAKAAIESLHDAGLGKGGEHSLGEVVWLKLDLGDPREAKKAAEEFLKLETRLDLLLNNAGDMYGDGAVGSDGVSSMHIVNYISPYVFTRTLLPLLKQTAAEPNSDVRIVNVRSSHLSLFQLIYQLTPSPRRYISMMKVSSKVHTWLPTGVQYAQLSDFNIKYNWRPFAKYLRYGNSKLAIILWSRHLQSQLLTSNVPITVLSLHPGVVDTASHTLPFPSLMKWLFSFATIPPEEGALTSLFAAASKKVKEDPEKYREGVYLTGEPEPGTVGLPSGDALDARLGEELVGTTERFLESIGV
ncbi:hypothetical protein MD484_g6621, partial [Candolleomyces efflorescens]